MRNAFECRMIVAAREGVKPSEHAIATTHKASSVIRQWPEGWRHSGEPELEIVTVNWTIDPDR